MTDGERRLIEILTERQKQLGLRDVPFAALLGVSQPHWSLLKRHKRGIGRQTASRLLARFPDLWREVQDALIPRQEPRSPAA